MPDQEKGTKNGYRWRNGNQFFAVILANIVVCGHGNLLGWISPTLPTLLSEDTPLKSGPLTNDQLSWIGSINSIGALCGTFATGILTHTLGAKRSMLLLAMPSILFWVLIFFGDTYYHVLIARVFVGAVGGGIQTTLILYTSEIANDNIRGKLSCFTPLFRNIGILLAYVIGAAADYTVVPCIFVLVPLLFVCSFSFVPNTCQFHLLRGENDKAESSLRFYKGCKGKNDAEIAALKLEFATLKATAHEKKTDETISLKDIFNRSAIRGLIIGITLAWLTQLTGGFTFVTYAVVIFKETGASHIDPYVASIAIAVVQIMGSLLTSQISDRLGRKFCVLVSLIGSAIGLFAFATYSYLSRNGYNLSSCDWIPVTCLSFVIFIASAGVIPLATVCTIENLPSKIRTLGLTISTLGFNIASFTCLKLFPILMASSIGLHGCMLIFAIACTLGAVFVFTTMEETKGRSLDQADKKVARVYKKSYGQLPSLSSLHQNVEVCSDKKY